MTQSTPSPSDGRAPAISTDLERDLRRVVAFVDRKSRSDRADIFATILLSLATVCSAWSAYQASRWYGIMSIRFADANRLRGESISAGDLADRQILVHLKLFLDWARAWEDDDRKVARTLEARFPPPLRTAFAAWAARGTLQPGQPLPPGTPLDLSEYRLPEADQARALTAAALAATAAAKHANHHGDNFIFTVVLFSSVLFFAALSTKLTSPRMQLVFLVLGGAFFLLAGGLSLSLPHRFGA